jgi:c-di-GMP-binding flagellar brake protein YcgR
MSDSENRVERRKHPRIKARIPVDVRSLESNISLRTAAEGISAGGCYIRAKFALLTGTRLGLTLWVRDEPIEVTALVATSYPHMGNGFEFVEIKPTEQLKLAEFILEHQRTRKASSS